MAIQNLEGSVPIIQNVFHLTLVHNRGIAFGLFRQYPQILMILISVSLVFIFIVAHQKTFRSSLNQLIFGLIFGGAIGNWVDRIRFQAVIDFLDFRVWPVFNIADSAITVGVGLFIIFQCFLDKGNVDG